MHVEYTKTQIDYQAKTIVKTELYLGSIYELLEILPDVPLPQYEVEASAVRRIACTSARE